MNGMKSGEKYLVVGSGISGIGSLCLLEQTGADAVLYDSSDKLTEEQLRERLPEGSRARCIAGRLPEEVMKEIGTVVLSPGVPTDLPLVDDLRAAGAAVIGEIELGYRQERGRVAAITGTNGKTTTTTLTGEILKAHLGQEKVFVVGNIGRPYTMECQKTTPETVTVEELSSFQLETVEEFHPAVSAILNITPDHLNRHHTMEAYISAKKNIARNQTEDDHCILNYEDRLTREFGENIRAQVLYFSSRRKLEKGIYLADGRIIYRDEEVTELCDIKELNLLGLHNYENVMAAAAMAFVYGVPAEIVRKSVKAFKGVEHRIEYVTEKNGVAYYNDSKGTNPDAAIKGIQAMNRPTVLIGGGYDKDSVYTEWINSFEGKVKRLVLVGATKEKIARDARTCGFYDYVFADTFEEAVLEAAKAAKPGDAVLLSPACASWGMFPNYEVRGEKFKEIVNSL